MVYFKKINKNSVTNEKTKQEDDIATKSLDKEQRASFVSTCRSKWKSGKPKYPHREALIFDMYTGLRVGELLALRWQDIDLERKTVRVAAEVAMVTDRDPNSSTYEKLVLVRNDYIKNNKPRIVPLSPKAVEAASNMKKLAKEGQEHFVCTEDGALVRPNTISKTMKKVCDAAGIELRFGTNVHALRHPYVKHTTKNISLQKQKSQTTNRFDSLGFLFSLLALCEILIMKMPDTDWHFHYGFSRLLSSQFNGLVY